MARLVLRPRVLPGLSTPFKARPLVSNSAWDADNCCFCMSRNPEYVVEYGTDGSRHPSTAVCRWCKRLLQQMTGEAFAVSNREYTKKRKKREEVLRHMTEHDALLGEIEEFLNAPN